MIHFNLFDVTDLKTMNISPTSSMDLDEFAEEIERAYQREGEESLVEYLLSHKDELQHSFQRSSECKDSSEQPSSSWEDDYSSQRSCYPQLPPPSPTVHRGNREQVQAAPNKHERDPDAFRRPEIRHHAKQQDAQHSVLPASATGRRSEATHPTRSTFSCYHCGSDAILDDRFHGDHVCTVCGTCSKYISDDGEHCLPFPELGMARSKAHMQLSKNCYKRVNYFSELLNQLIGQQQSRLPDWLIPKMKELLADRDPEDVTGPVVRESMSLMKMGKYYEHCHLIANALNKNYNLVLIDHQHHAKMMSMFKRIQKPFELHKGKRKNFFNYQFVLWQFFHILGIPQNCEFLTMLRCRKRLVSQDKLWRVICQEAKLPYISVIDVLFPETGQKPREASLPPGGVQKKRKKRANRKRTNKKSG